MEDMIDMLIRQDSRKRNRSSINESEKDYEINFDDIHIDMTKSKTTRNGNKWLITLHNNTNYCLPNKY